MADVKQGAIKPNDLALAVPGRIRIAGLRGLYGGAVRFDNNCTSTTKLTPEVVSELKSTFGEAVEELPAAEETEEAQG